MTTTITGGKTHPVSDTGYNPIFSAGAGTITIPASTSGQRLFAEAIGGGGNSSTYGGYGGGGGGAWASSYDISLTVGTTLIYFYVGNNQQDSWVNTTNAPPSSTSTGCLAKAASGHTSGTAAASIGLFAYDGGVISSGTGGACSGSSGGTGQTVNSSTGAFPSTPVSPFTFYGGAGSDSGSTSTTGKPGGGAGSPTYSQNQASPGIFRLGGVGGIRIAIYEKTTTLITDRTVYTSCNTAKFVNRSSISTVSSSIASVIASVTKRITRLATTSTITAMTSIQYYLHYVSGATSALTTAFAYAYNNTVRLTFVAIATTTATYSRIAKNLRDFIASATAITILTIHTYPEKIARLATAIGTAFSAFIKVIPKTLVHFFTAIGTEVVTIKKAIAKKFPIIVTSNASIRLVKNHLGQLTYFVELKTKSIVIPFNGIIGNPPVIAATAPPPVVNLAPYPAVRQATFVRFVITDNNGVQTIVRMSSNDLPVMITESDNIAYLYPANGSLLNVSQVTSDLKPTQGDVLVSIDGIQNQYMAAILQTRIKGAPIEVRRAFFDITTNVLLNLPGNPTIEFSGVINNFAVDEGWSIDGAQSVTSIINLSCTSLMSVLMRKITGRRTNQSDQNYWFPGDNAFSRVATLADSYYNFGAENAASPRIVSTPGTTQNNT